MESMFGKCVAFVGSVVVVMSLVLIPVRAAFTQQGHPCPAGEYECEDQGFEWCCDNNPKTSGGCVFLALGNRDCCAGSNHGDYNCGTLDVTQ